MAVTESDKILEAKKVAAKDPDQAILLYKEIIENNTKASVINDAQSREFETALLSLGELYRDQKYVKALVELITQSRSTLSTFAKAKTAKIVRQLLDLLAAIPKTTDTQITVTKSCIEWATTERRSFLRQNLEVRLVSLYMAKTSYFGKEKEMMVLSLMGKSR